MHDLLEEADNPPAHDSWAILDVALERAANPVKRLPTGLAPIDELMGGGIGQGEVCVIAGKSGSGKSLLAQGILEVNLQHLDLFVSIEMDLVQVFLRSMPIWGDRPGHAMSAKHVRDWFNDNSIPPAWQERWAQAHQKQVVVDVPVSIAGIERAIEEQQAKFDEPVRLVVLDYMELIRGAVSSDEGGNGVQAIAQELKYLAKRAGVGVIVLHQLNARGKPGRPIYQDHLKFAGFTEADQVLTVWRPHDYRAETKGDVDLEPWERERLAQQIAVGLIKNRPVGGAVAPEGFLFPLRSSGRIVGTEPRPCPAAGEGA